MANGKMDENGIFYYRDELIGKSIRDLVEVIDGFLEDDDQMMSAAFDLIHAIKEWCVTQEITGE